MSTPARLRQVYVRVGHRYLKTIGGHGTAGGRSFESPVDVAWDSTGRIYVANASDVNVRVTVLGLDDEFFLDFSSTGVQDGQLSWPGGIAVDRSDTIYVSDQHTHSINLFSTDGKFLGKWGKRGSGDGELKEPSGLAFDSEYKLYVVDTGNDRVQKFTMDGMLLVQWGNEGREEGQFDMPWGIALDEENNVYVADWHNDRVQKFTADGEFLLSLGASGSGNGQFHRPSGVAVDRGGDIYVADWGNNRVQVFDPQGNYQLKFTGDATLSKWGLETVLASSDYLRQRHRASLEPERQLWRPCSVKVDSQDRIFIVDTNRHRLQIYQKESVTVDPEFIDLDNPFRPIDVR